MLSESTLPATPWTSLGAIHSVTAAPDRDPARPARGYGDRDTMIGNHCFEVVENQWEPMLLKVAG